MLRYEVEVTGDFISVERVASQAELNKIHFFLLGNRFETLFMPSAIVLVEGKSDVKFIERAVALRFPNARISIIPANGDSRIKEVLNVTRSIFGDLQRSPYRDRIFVVLDSVHGSGLSDQLLRMGIQQETLIRWSQNGIEHVYPPSILDSIYGLSGTIAVQGDSIWRNDLAYTKNELAEKVCAQLTPTTQHHEEFERLLLAPLTTRLG